MLQHCVPTCYRTLLLIAHVCLSPLQTQLNSGDFHIEAWWSLKLQCFNFVIDVCVLQVGCWQQSGHIAASVVGHAVRRRLCTVIVATAGQTSQTVMDDCLQHEDCMLLVFL